MQSAREHLAGKLGKERREQIQFERAKQMMTDLKLRGEYFENVEAELKSL